MKTRIAIVLAALLVMLPCKGGTEQRPAPKTKSTVYCWDGSKVKDVGPGSCDDRGGKDGR